MSLLDTAFTFLRSAKTKEEELARKYASVLQVSLAEFSPREARDSLGPGQICDRFNVPELETLYSKMFFLDIDKAVDFARNELLVMEEGNPITKSKLYNYGLSGDTYREEFKREPTRAKKRYVFTYGEIIYVVKYKRKRGCAKLAIPNDLIQLFERPQEGSEELVTEVPETN